MTTMMETCLWKAMQRKSDPLLSYSSRRGLPVLQKASRGLPEKKTEAPVIAVAADTAAVPDLSVMPAEADERAKPK